MLYRAISLAFFSLSGNTGLVNLERGYYQEVSVQQLMDTAREILQESNCSVMHYCSTVAA